MNYREEIKDSAYLRSEYNSQLRELINKRQTEAVKERTLRCKNILDEGEKFREELKNILGWPLNADVDRSIPEVKKEHLTKEGCYDVYRMRVNVMDDLYVNGLFFKKDDGKKRPLVIVQHGGWGTPEFLCGFHHDLGTANYNDLLESTLAGDVDAFVPQLVIWDNEKFEVKQDRQAFDTELRRLGGSITALEIFAIMRVLDYFEAQDHVKNFGMAGLSYGGMYTLLTTAVETRILSAVSSCYFNDRNKYQWADWTWFDAANRLSDAEIACLAYPRKLRVQCGDKDNLFDGESAVEESKRVYEYCNGRDSSWFEFLLFDGGHEFYTKDGCLAKMTAELHSL